MRITPVPDSFHTKNNSATGSQGQSSGTVGGSGRKKDQHKGAKSKKRLFAEKAAGSATNAKTADPHTTQVQTRNAQEAANFLSSAMGIPVSVNLKTSTPYKKNGNESITPSVNSTKKTAPMIPASATKNPFNANMPSAAGLTRVSLSPIKLSSPMTFPPLPQRPNYAQNFTVSAQSWMNFNLDTDKLMKALKIAPYPTPPP